MKSFLLKLRSLLGMIALVISVPIWTPVVIFCSFFKNPALTSWSIQTWNRFVLRCFAIKVKIHGEQNYRADLPCLMVSNHQSLMDIPTLVGMVKGHLRMVAKKELFSIPLFGRAMKAGGCIPLDRGNHSSGREVSNKIGEEIRKGLQIWVAPEGTRSEDGTVREFKKGSFAVAIDAQVPVQPVAVVGAIDVLNRKSWLPHPYKTLHLGYCHQIDCSGLTTDDRGELAVKTRQAIIEEMARIARTKES